MQAPRLATLRRQAQLPSTGLPASVLFAAFVLVADGAHAALQARGGGLVYDTELNVTWLADANFAASELTAARVSEIVATAGPIAGHALSAAEFLHDDSGAFNGRMTWWAAMAWTEQLVYYNSAYGVSYSDWRLPRSAGPDPTCKTLAGAARTDGLGFSCTGGELGHLFYSELGGTAALSWGSLATGTDPDLQQFSNLRLDFYHYADAAVACPNMPGADCGVYFSLYSGIQWATGKAQFNYVLPVLDGDVALRDTDGDGLTDPAEAATGTNPNLADTDHDGLVDGAGGVVPIGSVSAGIDSNQDGFADGEQDFGTDPRKTDSDADGSPDGIEILHGSNPLDRYSLPAPADGDLAPYGYPDGNIDAADVLIAMRIVAGQLMPRVPQYAHGDMNMDGMIDLSDLAVILRQALE
ncbi:MAG: hypothetical protein R3F42_16285 [Pseudomonadota bacterium]